MPLQKAFVYSYLIDDRQHRCVGKLVNAGTLQESEETDTISFNSYECCLSKESFNVK